LIITTMLRTTAFFLLLFLIPGYITLRALKLRGPDRAEVLFLSVFSSTLLTSWLGLLLAEIALFSLWSLSLLLLIYSLGMAVAFKVKPAWSGIPRLRLDIGYWLLVIIVVAGLLFFRPFESILGTSDSGVYLGMGVNIARTGAIRARDPLLTDLSDGIENDLLYSYRFPYGSELMRFFGDGVRIWDMKRGMLFSQQNHLYQVWIAIFYSIFGTPIFLYVTPLFGLLGVIGLYFAGKALFDDRVGLLASFLLAINVVQIWFSRWAMSEVLTQFLVLGALYFFALYVKTAQHVTTHPLSPDRQIRRPGLDLAIQAERGGQSAQRCFGLLAGFGLGLAVLSRADGVFLIVPVALYFAYLRLTRRLRLEHLYFFVPFAALLLHWTIHSLFFSRGQFLAIGRALPYFSSIGPLAVGGAVLIAALLILAFLNYAKLVSAVTRLQNFGKWIRPAVALLIVLLALYAYFIRPGTADPQMVYYHPAGGMIRTYNEENLVRLGWYVTPLGLLLALGGLVAMISKETDEGVIFFLGVAMLCSFVFLHSALVNPIHIYWIRRYITVVIPSIMLFISYGLSKISNIQYPISTTLSRVRRILVAILAIALAASFLRTSLALVEQMPYQGAIAQMNRFAEQFSDRAVVIFESPLVGDPFALPLTYLYGRDSFVLQGQGPNSEQFSDLVGRWRERGREVFYIAYDGLTRVRSDDYSFSPVGEVTLDLPLPETSFDHLPKGIVHHPYELEIYKIEPAWKAEAIIYPFSLDVGRFDYGYLMSGFHAREGGPGGRYRWTGKTAEILLPWAPEGKSLVLSLAVGSQRPAEVEPAKVTLYLNGLLLDQLDLGDEFKTHTVVISADFITEPQAKSALLRLETNPWIPAEVGLEDVRELGIILNRVELDKAP
jgi:4-amino-4-deoxy-L-arabinose transferase-like glycosyltransferase